MSIYSIILSSCGMCVKLMWRMFFFICWLKEVKRNGRMSEASGLVLSECHKSPGHCSCFSMLIIS